MIPPLIADAGEVRTVRRAANYVYGSWRVTVPEGAELTAVQDDRTDGYLHRPESSGRGRFDVSFVRQDATIDIHEVTNQGVTSGHSDVELQMDAGQKRAEGRALIERDISGRGLGRLVPGVDFSTGDIVPVKVWGKIIHLPVTALDWTTNASGVAAAAVRVGGQLISDVAKLRSLNDEILLQVDAERRRAAAEEKRLADQAETDRQQTSAIQSAQSSLSSQQSQIRTWSTSVVNHSDQLAQLLTVLADPDKLNTGLLWSIRDLAMAVKDLTENTEAGRTAARHIADSTLSLVTGDMAQIVSIGKFNKLPSVPPPSN